MRQALGLAFLLAAIPRVAQAGNLDAFYLSGDAALQAGAITADVSGGGAAWYNPAALSTLRGLRFDVSVNGYAVRFGGTASLDPAVPGAEVARFDRLDFNVVPTALTITRRFKHFGAAIGAFVPTQSASALRTRFWIPAPGGGRDVSFDYSYDATSRVQSYHLGAAVGFDTGKNLSLGGAFLVTYQTLADQLSTSLITNEGGLTYLQNTHYTLDSVQVGAEFVAAMRYKFLETWRLGLVMRSPALLLGEHTQIVETLQTANGSTASGQNGFSEALTLSTAIISPFRFHAGLSHDFSPEFRGAIDTSLLLPFENDLFSLRPTFNARVGVRRVLSDYLAIGGGVFTDRSPNQAPTAFQDSQIDFYGGTIAVEIARDYGIYAENKVPFERARALRFATTIGLSYAIGTGMVMQAQVSTAPGGGINSDPIPQSVLAHELTLHIGSAVME